jgi:hypothetical protein
MPDQIFREQAGSMLRRKRNAQRDNQVTSQGAPPDHKLTETELNALIPLKEAERLSSLSEDTWRRKYAHLIVHLSTRRCAIRLKYALFLERPPSCP